MSDRQVIVAREKHGDFYYDATTPEAWARSALEILTERFDSGYHYFDGDPDANHHFVQEQRAKELEASAPDLSDEDLRKLPVEARKPIIRARQRIRDREMEFESDRIFYAAVKEIVEDQDAGMITVGHGRWEREVPKAWKLLQERSDYEYEDVSLEPLR